MTTDRVAGIGLALLAVVILEESWRLRLPLGSFAMPGPAYVPAVLAAALLVSGLVIAVQGARAPRLAEVGWVEWRQAMAIAGTCAFLALALERLGYRLTVAVACLFLLTVVERKSVAAALVFSAAMALGTYYLFDTVLRVQLPRGPFGF
jgi:putative tricarboxylic transport membrane protein